MRIIDVDEAIAQLENRERWQPTNEVCPRNSNGEKCVPVSSVKKFLDNRPTFDPWVPVTDRLPEEEDGRVIGTDGSRCYIISRNQMYASPEGEIRVPANYGKGATITHWMPRPKLPQVNFR